jgi:hypothetical protein
MAKREATNEDSNARGQAVEEVESAHSCHAREVEEGPLDPKICEGLVQAFVDPVSPAGYGVCLHRCPSQLKKWLSCIGWNTARSLLKRPKAKSERLWRVQQSPCRLRRLPELFKEERQRKTSLVEGAVHLVERELECAEIRTMIAQLDPPHDFS